MRAGGKCCFSLHLHRDFRVFAGVKSYAQAVRTTRRETVDKKIFIARKPGFLGGFCAWTSAHGAKHVAGRVGVHYLVRGLKDAAVTFEGLGSFLGVR